MSSVHPQKAAAGGSVVVVGAAPLTSWKVMSKNEGMCLKKGSVTLVSMTSNRTMGAPALRVVAIGNGARRGAQGEGTPKATL